MHGDDFDDVLMETMMGSDGSRTRGTAREPVAIPDPRRDSPLDQGLEKSKTRSSQECLEEFLDKVGRERGVAVPRPGVQRPNQALKKGKIKGKKTHSP